MRIPIPVALLLVLIVGGGTWWKNTRKMDFMTPPSEAKLAEIRVKVESSFPRTDVADDAISVPAELPEPPPPVAPPKAAIDLGDLTKPPALLDYGELAPKGAAYMIELATALEQKGEFQRALLAWERVIDFTQLDDAQTVTAISSIKRLRPTLPDWNTKPEAAIVISLHAGTGKKLAKILSPIIEGVARDLEMAASGVIKVKATVTIGKTSTLDKGPTPVALWLSGPEQKSISTEVLSFTVDSLDSLDTLRQDVMKTVFQLVRSHLKRATAYTPPVGLAEGEDPQAALNFHITRLCWSEFATAMNLRPPPSPPLPSPPKKRR